MKHCGKKLLGLLAAAALCLAVGVGAGAEEPEVVTEPGANEPEFESADEWLEYYTAMYPVETYADPVALQSGGDYGFSVSNGYTVTIPSDVTVDSETGSGTLQISGSLHPYRELTIGINSENKFNLKSSDDENFTLAYTLSAETDIGTFDSANNKLTYSTSDTQADIDTNLNVNVTENEETAKLSGDYTDRLTFTFSYRVKQYTITYEGNGGTTQDTKGVTAERISKAYECGQYATLAANPAFTYTKDGKKQTFVGWSTSETVSGTDKIYAPGVSVETLWPDGVMDKNTKTLYAQWKETNAQEYTVNFYLESQSSSGWTSPSYTYEKNPVTLTLELEPGATKMWNAGELMAMGVITAAKTDKHNRRLTDAECKTYWEDQTESVTVPTESSTAINVYVNRKKVTLNLNAITISKDGTYTKQANLTDGTNRLATVELWVENSKIQQTGTGESDDFYTPYTYGAEYTFKNLIKSNDNYEYVGYFYNKNESWKGENLGSSEDIKNYLNKDGVVTAGTFPTDGISGTLVGYLDSTLVDITKTQTLYLIFKEKDDSASTEKQLCYKANGGTGDDKTDSYDTTATLQKCEFKAPEGKQFAGWSTTQIVTSNDDLYQPGTALSDVDWGGQMLGDSRTLYAQWGEDCAIDIYYETNDSTQGVASGSNHTRKSICDVKTIHKVLLTGKPYTWTNPKLTEVGEVDKWKNKTYTIQSVQTSGNKIIAERVMYSIDLNVAVWNAETGKYEKTDEGTNNWGRTNVYVNGKIPTNVNGDREIGNWISDYYTGHPYGLTCEFKDITPMNNYKILGWKLNGNIGNVTGKENYGDGPAQIKQWEQDKTELDVEIIADNKGSEGDGYVEGNIVVWLFVEKTNTTQTTTDTDTTKDTTTPSDDAGTDDSDSTTDADGNVIIPGVTDTDDTTEPDAGSDSASTGTKKDEDDASSSAGTGKGTDADDTDEDGNLLGYGLDAPDPAVETDADA